MSVAASALSLFVAPMLESTDLKMKALAFLAASAGFFVVFLVTTRILALYRYRKLRGKWYYVTHPYEDAQYKDGNFAIMEFSVNRNFDIEYKVYLYYSVDSLKNQRSAKVKGKASSKALHYNLDKGEVHILFEVKYMTGDPTNINREGRLSLQLFSDGSLAGDWTSEVHIQEDGKTKRTSSSGKMRAFRTVDELIEYEAVRKGPQ